MLFSTAYEDEEDVLKLPANHLPYCVDDLTFNVPLCVPDPADPTKIPCYNKSQVSNLKLYYTIFVISLKCDHTLKFVEFLRFMSMI